MKRAKIRQSENGFWQKEPKGAREKSKLCGGSFFTAEKGISVMNTPVGTPKVGPCPLYLTHERELLTGPQPGCCNLHLGP
jgi:hypothetical protein